MLTRQHTVSRVLAAYLRSPVARQQQSWFSSFLTAAPPPSYMFPQRLSSRATFALTACRIGHVRVRLAGVCQVRITKNREIAIGLVLSRTFFWQKPESSLMHSVTTSCTVLSMENKGISPTWIEQSIASGCQSNLLINLWIQLTVEICQTEKTFIVHPLQIAWVVVPWIKKCRQLGCNESILHQATGKTGLTHLLKESLIVEGITNCSIHPQQTPAGLKTWLCLPNKLEKFTFQSVTNPNSVQFPHQSFLHPLSQFKRQLKQCSIASSIAVSTQFTSQTP